MSSSTMSSSTGLIGLALCTALLAQLGAVSGMPSGLMQPNGHSMSANSIISDGSGNTAPHGDCDVTSLHNQAPFNSLPSTGFVPEDTKVRAAQMTDAFFYTCKQGQWVIGARVMPECVGGALFPLFDNGFFNFTADENKFYINHAVVNLTGPGGDLSFQCIDGFWARQSAKLICVEANEDEKPVDGNCPAGYVRTTVRQGQGCPHPVFEHCKISLVHSQEHLPHGDRLVLTNINLSGPQSVRLDRIRAACPDGLPDLRANGVSDGLKRLFNKWGKHVTGTLQFWVEPIPGYTSRTEWLYNPASEQMSMAKLEHETTGFAVCHVRKARHADCIYPKDLHSMTFPDGGECPTRNNTQETLLHSPRHCHAADIALCYRRDFVTVSNTTLHSVYIAPIDKGTCQDLGTMPPHKPTISGVTAKNQKQWFRNIMQSLKEDYPAVRANGHFNRFWTVDANKKEGYFYPSNGSFVLASAATPPHIALCAVWVQ